MPGAPVLSINILPDTAFVFLLVFARLGSMIMMMPAIGENGIPARVRLIMALLLTALIMPLVAGSYGKLPETITGTAMLIVFEIAVGIFIGMAARLIMAALHVAGNIIALQMSLAFAQNVDPSQGHQGVLVANFLNLLAIALIFATDMDHMLIAAMRDSYELFKPGQYLPVGDFSQMAVETFSHAFRLGLQLAAPFLVFGLIFYLGIGVISRLMPQIQIFFIAMPANITLGLVLLMVLLGAMMTWFLDSFESTVMLFVH